MENLDAVSLDGLDVMDHDPAQGTLNISDVIEVIRTTDPVYDDVTSAGNMEESVKRAATVQIIEQPASKALRFRYECEGRSAGSIPGVNSTPENKTFPSIQIIGYKGPAVVVVSCVTKDPPYRPHPHNLVGKEGCKQGVCTMKIDNESMAVTFSNLGIQCVKKKDIEEALKLREQIRVDPFRTGYTHRNQPTSIDLNAVRLCFQVFLEGPVPGKFTIQLTPVVSDPIYDKKAMSDLVICKLSHCSCSVAGGKEIILLCEKVAKEDIQVRFYEEQAGHIVWEANGDFQPTQVHKQVAITFRSPRYKTLEIEDPVKVNIQLRRPSDGITSVPLPFEFQPLDSDRIKRKRQKYDEYGVDTRQFQELDKLSRTAREHIMNASPDPSQPQHLIPIKREPVDPTPSGYHPYLGSNTSTMFSTFRTMPPTPSPQAPSPSSVGRTPSPMEVVPWPPMESFYAAPKVPGFRLDHTQHGSNYHFMPNTFGQGTSPGTVNANLGNDVGTMNRGIPGMSVINNLNVTGFGSSMSNNVMPGMSNIAHNPNHIDLPSNNPSITANVIAVDNQEHNIGETSLVDLDNQYMPTMDSTEIVNLFLATGSLSESISCNLTLSDNKPATSASAQEEPQENMSDSVKSIMRELHDLNNSNQPGGGCNN